MMMMMMMMVQVVNRIIIFIPAHRRLGDKHPVSSWSLPPPHSPPLSLFSVSILTFLSFTFFSFHLCPPQFPFLTFSFPFSHSSCLHFPLKHLSTFYLFSLSLYLSSPHWFLFYLLRFFSSSRRRKSIRRLWCWNADPLLSYINQALRPCQKREKELPSSHKVEEQLSVL